MSPHRGRIDHFWHDVSQRGRLRGAPRSRTCAASTSPFSSHALNDLAAAIPKGWRVPRPATTAEGRNVELFLALCKLSLGGSDDGLLTWARTLNREFKPHLADAEVQGVWRSVCRYRARWRVHGHTQGWLWRQAARGKRGGLAAGVKRRAGTLLEQDRAPWEVEGGTGNGRSGFVDCSQYR